MTTETIAAYIPDQPAFSPQDVAAMSQALEAVCDNLNIFNNRTAREVIAIRIIELARRGERSFEMLRDRVLVEANGGSGL
jgi:hypothetical protein